MNKEFDSGSWRGVFVDERHTGIWVTCHLHRYKEWFCKYSLYTTKSVLRHSSCDKSKFWAPALEPWL